MLHCHPEKDFYIRQFQDPGLPETGIAADLLFDELKNYMDGKEFSSTRQEHVAAFEWLLQNIRIGVSPDDLFVTLGFWGRKPIEKVLWPTKLEYVRETLCASTLELRNDFINANHGCFFTDFAHSVPDWRVILSLGFPGLLKRVEEAEKKFYDEHDGKITAEQKEFFLSIKSEYEQVLLLLDRIIAAAEKTKCQAATIKAIRTLRNGAPATFYEAMLLIWLYYQISEYGDCVQTRSFGNLDVALIDFYRNDLASGEFTEADIRTLIQNFYRKVNSMNYRWGHPFYLGGTLANGESACNELTTIFLEEHGNLKIFDPKIQIKLAENTPVKHIDQALKLIRSGNNSIVFVGEPCIRNTMLHYGYTEEEARTAVIKGCYEFCPQESSVSTACCICNMPGVLLGSLKRNQNAATFEDLYSACIADFKQALESGMIIADDFEQHLDKINPAPLLSGISANALERGLDGYCKGAKYNNSDVWFSGPATVTDSLVMIKKYVYEQKELTLPEFLTILENNWQDHTELQMKIRQDTDHFGNNSKYDVIAKQFLEQLASFINFRKNSRGGVYTTALHSADYFRIFGGRTNATPDGRSTGEELTKNITPRQGGSFSGVTALISSVLKLDSANFMGDFPVDIMFHPSAIAGDDGLCAMRALLMTYIKKKGHAIHFNVFSSEMLRDAQEHPEKYEDLQVRICGWNLLWNTLSRDEQNAYLAQAEANDQRH